MYTFGTYITQPIGNNEFHYNGRVALGSVAKIFVPSLIKGNLADLEEGSEICFEEIENGRMKSCTGLKYFIQTEYEGTPVYIIDNHNHALSFRDKTKTLIHIDQHTDTKENNEKLIMDNEKGIESFVNEKTNVGNFISAALQNNIIDEVIQVRSDYALKQLGAGSFKLGSNYIVDIDVDFWEGKENYEADFETIRQLILHAKLVTIATSPYFMDQKKAIEIVKSILK